MSAELQKTGLKTFHATMAVTRLEEWCVDANTAEEAKGAAGRGPSPKPSEMQRRHRLGVIETRVSPIFISFGTPMIMAREHDAHRLPDK